MILRVCVVIPVHDSPRTISSVVKDVVTRAKFPVLIVDDGSETPAEHVLYSFEVRQAIEEGRVRVLRFPRRRGRGALLRAAVEMLSADGFTHVAMLEGDGSHSAKHIPAMVEAAGESPWSVVSAGDWTSDLVLYPVFPLQGMRWWSRGRAVTLELAFRFLVLGFDVREMKMVPGAALARVFVPVRALGRMWPRRLWRGRPREQISFAFMRGPRRWFGSRIAGFLGLLVAGWVYAFRPGVRAGLHQFYSRIYPKADRGERRALAFRHVLTFVDRLTVARIRPPLSGEIEMIPFLGRLAPVEVEQLPIIRELEKSILGAPDKWTRFYPYWSTLPERDDSENMLFEDLEGLEELEEDDPFLDR